ncbi:MAG: hypothetical protein WBA41_20130 [Rivularia sp. (in: cyanobacteria)]
MLHLLEALQILQIKFAGSVEPRRLSFRALDIEQIGHVYEGLLDHTAIRANSSVLGLMGTKDKEPEIDLETLENLSPNPSPARKGEQDSPHSLLREGGWGVRFFPIPQKTNRTF